MDDPRHLKIGDRLWLEVDHGDDGGAICVGSVEFPDGRPSAILEIAEGSAFSMFLDRISRAELGGLDVKKILVTPMWDISIWEMQNRAGSMPIQAFAIRKSTSLDQPLRLEGLDPLGKAVLWWRE